MIEYKAINGSNQIVIGTIQDDQGPHLESLLLDQGLRLISYRNKRKARHPVLTYAQQQTLWMSLRYYMSAGLTLVQAIQHMKQGILDEHLQGIIHSIEVKLVRGESLSNAIQIHLPLNDELTQRLLETAERTGSYEDVLLDLEAHATWRVEFIARIQKALRYPMIVFSALWIAFYSMLYVFAPQLKSYFQHTGGELPTVTQILLALSDWTVEWPMTSFTLPLTVCVAMWGATILFPRLQQAFLYIPGIRHLVLGYMYTVISKTLYLNLKHGYDVVNGLKQVHNNQSNRWMKPVLNQIITDITTGMPLSESLRKYPGIFTSFFVQLITVGEQSNTLKENFKVLYSYYEQETRSKVFSLIKWIEPSMLLVMGLMLIGMISGLFYPLYSQLSVTIGH